MISGRPRAVVFDMDDTLYLERDYVRSGFLSVGRWLERHHGVRDFAETAWALFEEGRRGDIFDVAVARLGFRRVSVGELVDRYRRHRPRISLMPDAERWIERKPEQVRLALITDGPVASQSRKASALGLREQGFRPIVLTDRWGMAFRKPNSRAFRLVERQLGLRGGDLVYVADNPAKDFVAPRALGWATVQIIRPGALHAEREPVGEERAADRVIQTLDQLDWG